MFENWKKIFYSLQDDKSLDEIYQVSLKMMKSAEGLLDHCIDSLRYKETLREKRDVYAWDKEINELEAEVRRKLFMYQTMERPVKNHRAVLVMSLISHDIERIGDYAKNIFDLSERYDDSQKFGKFDGDVKQIENLIQSEFSKLISYFVEFNEVVHKVIGDGLTYANSKIEELLSVLQDKPEESGLETKVIISLVMYLRFMKRVSSHLRNISSSYYNPVDRIGFNLE